MKSLLCLIAALACVSLLPAQSGDALSVMNAFIATFAKDNPSWKSDIVVTSDPRNVAPGRQLGYSSIVGYYTFLPKTWGELSDMERAAVYADPRLKPFIVSLRNYNNYPALTNTDTPRPAFPVYPIEGMRPTPVYYPQQLMPAPALVQPYTPVQAPAPQVGRMRISPEEMLLDRPLKIYMNDNR
jgi:hypothetical protein